ncbi:BNR repeat-like domain [Gaiella occulta]|uniref:BNR repeat-like domain n=1 Tax=Gaiella occulta TaxID=1002870 RepID=A0A7M2YXQ1_9ACTN|nr:BNR repeat-like domain [Gaiella occulta]
MSRFVRQWRGVRLRGISRRREQTRFRFAPGALAPLFVTAAILMLPTISLVVRAGGATAAGPSVSVQVVLENPDYETLAVAGDVAYGRSTSDAHAIWRSSDHGLTWTKVLTLASNERLVSISALSSGTVLAHVDTGSMTLFRSGDQGATWTRVLSLPSSPVFYTTLTPASISDGAGYVWLGTYNITAADFLGANYLYRSSDDGRSWAVVSSSTGHRHIHGVKYNGANGKLYVFFGDANGGGIWVSSDNGISISPLCTDYACTIIDAAFDPGGASAVFGTDNYTSQNRIVKVSLADGARTQIMNIPYDSFSAYRLPPSTYLIGTTHEPGVPIVDPNLHLYVSTDGGTTFTDAYRIPIPFADGRADLQVQFSYPNGDFPIQVDGHGTIVARLVTAGGASPPANTVLPAVSGTAQVGQILTSTTGSWTGTVPITYSRQWQSCSGADCTGIAGATGATYAPVAADVGFALRVRVTAGNSAGVPTSADSTPTAAVVPAGGSSGGAVAGGGGAGDGGAGGGGAGGGGADLSVTGSVEPASAPVGGTLTWRLQLVDKNRATASGAYVDVQLPGGVSLAYSQTDRGAGCKPLGVALRCALDYLANDAPVGNVTLVTSVTTAGELVLRAVGGFAAADPAPADNTITLKANSPSASAPEPPAPPSRGVQKPRITHTRLLPLRALADRGVAVLETRVRVDRRARLTVVVRDVRTGAAVTSFPGSRFGTSVLRAGAKTLTTTVDRRTELKLRLLVRYAELTVGQRYAVMVTATSAGGTSRLRFPFAR